MPANPAITLGVHQLDITLKLGRSLVRRVASKARSRDPDQSKLEVCPARTVTCQRGAIKNQAVLEKLLA